MISDMDNEALLVYRIFQKEMMRVMTIRMESRSWSEQTKLLLFTLITFLYISRIFLVFCSIR